MEWRAAFEQVAVDELQRLVVVGAAVNARDRFGERAGCFFRDGGSRRSMMVRGSLGLSD
jgi:hypothetical protein